MRFTAQKIRFGKRPADAAEGEEDERLAPRLRLKVGVRRNLAIRDAQELVNDLPSEGECDVGFLTRRLDLVRVIDALLDKCGPCQEACLATLGYNTRALQMLLRWKDEQKVDRMWLLASRFFRSHFPDRWTLTQDEFARRGLRCAVAPSHAKIYTFAFASGQRLVLSSSGNLSASGSVAEHFELVHSAALHEKRRAWIVEVVCKHEGKNESG